MSIGNNIKKLRELRNYTQSYVAEKLSMSLSGYSKIERDETDISVKRLQEISKVLNAHYQQIVEFDDKGIFNITQNQNAEGIQHAYTVIENQQNIDNKNTDKIVKHLMNENSYLRDLLTKQSKR